MKKKMRNPKRRKRILKLIGRIWGDYPDLRLLQLIGNCFKKGDLYYLEDEKLEEKLKDSYKL